jgi:cytochrome c553
MKDNKPMKTLLTLTTFCALILLAGVSMAGSADAGKQKSSGCVSCHGMNGKSTNPNVPNLAGQKKNYLQKALTLYRDKKREDAMMNSLTASLSDADIDDIATYYSSVK